MKKRLSFLDCVNIIYIYPKKICMVRVRKDRRGKDEKIRTDCKNNGVGIVCLTWRISSGTGISESEAVSGSTRTADTRGSLHGDRAGSVSVVYAGDFL